MKIIITEEQYKFINYYQDISENVSVNSLIRRYENLIKEKGVGILGKMEESDLINPTNKYADELDYIYELYLDYNFRSDDEDIDYEKMEDEIFSKVKDTIVYNMWNNYKNAMERNRPNSALSLERFANYLNSGNVFLFEHNGSFVIGNYANGFFKPSHFAPKNIREGVGIIKELIKYDNIIFAVTDDLKEMLDKLGAYSNEKLVIPMIFREMLVTKHVVLTNPFIMAQVLNGLKNNEYKSISDFENITYDDF